MRILDERYDAQPGSVSQARSDIAACAGAAGVGDGQLEGIRLAVSEAVTNSVVHGYRGAPGRVRVVAELRAQDLSIQVSDGGDGLGCRADRPGLGRGLALIAEVADEMTIGSGPRGGTELRMRFALAAQPALAAAA